MLASLIHEFRSALSLMDDGECEAVDRTVSVATGEAAYGTISMLARELESRCPRLKIRVFPVKNRFFGGEVTVTGLLTGGDIAARLEGEDLGEVLLLSRTTLRAEGDLFLDGMTPEELSQRLGVPVEFADNDGAALLDALCGM